MLSLLRVLSTFLWMSLALSHSHWHCLPTTIVIYCIFKDIKSLLAFLFDLVWAHVCAIATSTVFCNFFLANLQYQCLCYSLARNLRKFPHRFCSRHDFTYIRGWMQMVTGTKWFIFLKQEYSKARSLMRIHYIHYVTHLYNAQQHSLCA